MKRVHAMPFGAVPRDGGACFRLWAPSVAQVELLLSAGPQTGVQPMTACADGWFEAVAEHADATTRYAFRLPDGRELPDPASRWNPQDVHGPSALVDPAAFDWPDAGWRGRPWHEAVVYELHVGSFTPEGTFAAAAGRLDELAALGVTAIELMPVAEFAGRRGWGYDGVLPFAPESAYGTPHELKQLVAAAHARGLMVLLDVVYNHFGPEGNVLHTLARPFFDPARRTPWGPAIAFDGPHAATVRGFFVHNALYWLEEFHVDGLRIDAVHAMHDRSGRHLVEELAQAVHDGPGRERQVHLVLENHRHDPAWLARDAGGRPVAATAQWNDDLHHAAHGLVTGECDGYYAAFADDPLGHLGRALAEGSDPRRGAAPRPGGTAPAPAPAPALPPTAFVAALQTHDQVGNRAYGERLGTLAAAAGRLDRLRALTACVLLAPQVPMLFMGEEFAADSPFLYFCDFPDALARAVARGRRAEFARFAAFADAAARTSIPDPNAASSFTRSRLDWAQRGRAPHAAWMAFVRELLACRRRHLVPWLDGAAAGRCERPAPGTLRLCWPLAGGRRWHLLAQLDDAPGPPGLADALPGEQVFAGPPAAEAVDGALAPWSVRVALEAPDRPPTAPSPMPA